MTFWNDPIVRLVVVLLVIAYFLRRLGLSSRTLLRTIQGVVLVIAAVGVVASSVMSIPGFVSLVGFSVVAVWLWNRNRRAEQDRQQWSSVLYEPKTQSSDSKPNQTSSTLAENGTHE